MAHSDWTDEFLELNKAVSNNSNEISSEFTELSKDSLNSLSDDDRSVYLKNKKINDSIIEKMSIDKAIEDSIMLADGKI